MTWQTAVVRASAGSESGKPRRAGAGRQGRSGQGRSDSAVAEPRSAGSRSGSWSRPADAQVPRTEEQARYDGPPIPEEITGQELDRSVSGQLKGLPDKLALRVARHLAAAGMLIETDPETAYQHTLAARARALRGWPSSARRRGRRRTPRATTPRPWPSSEPPSG